MKAVQIHQYGNVSQLQYEEIPAPQAKGEQVLVRVHAAGVNPVDYKTRAGSGIAGLFTQNPFPLILGWDMAGIIEEAPADSRFSVGDKVYGMVNFPDVGATYADYLVANPQDIAFAPQAIDLNLSASVPLAALTAWQALFEVGNLQAGDRILIHAAAGGVGHLAVQFARWKGARLIGTASAKNIDYLKEIGVDEVIDYHTSRFEDVLNELDFVLDCIGGDVIDRSWRTIKRGGTLVTIADGTNLQQSDEYGVVAKHMMVYKSGEQLAQIASLIDKGFVKPTVDRVFPLASVAEAHQVLESGHVRGKIILQMSD